VGVFSAAGTVVPGEGLRARVGAVVVRDELDEGVDVFRRAAPRGVLPDRLSLRKGISYIDAQPDAAPV